MKTSKTRIVSALLVIMTLLSLLPTTAFAATGTGKGITITTNQVYWSTRILANGTPYSYRPPEAAGRLLYCLDSGLGYHNATPSYCDSFTYTSATNADADAVLKTAVANSGLGEMDAATLANVKWLMTYINDSKASNIGQLFMAVQTYIWDHQSYKGAGDGTGDAGGYANTDTYDLYLSLIDSMLAQKAQEDAEFQRQIAEYAEQGIVAAIVEDDSAKWAVFALSSNRKNQSFFNYYGPRDLMVNEAPIPGNPAGDADITLKKVAAGTTQGLDGAKFNIYRDGQIVGSDVTKNGGIIEVKDVTKGLWSFVETEAPAGYCADSTPISVYVDTTDGDKQYMQMQTFVTQPNGAAEGFDGYNGDLTGDVAATLGVNCGMSTGRNGVMAFAANQRDEVRDLHDVAGALGAQPGMKQQTFVAGFSAGAGASAGGIGYNESVAPTLKGSPGGNCMPSVLCLNDQGGQSMAYSENITGTLRAQERGHQPLVLNPADPLLYENYGIDSRYTGPHKIAPTLSARMGTGGLNTSLVQQVPEEVICIAGNAIDRQPQNGGNGFGWQRDISYTLTTSDRHSVYARQRVDEFKDGEVFSTQSARQHKDATDLICQQAESYAYLIRRLTPLECERLQGFPDGWTDIPGASDSARYKALGNSLAIPCVEFIMSRIAAAMRAA